MTYITRFAITNKSIDILVRVKTAESCSEQVLPRHTTVEHVGSLIPLNVKCMIYFSHRVLELKITCVKGCQKYIGSRI